MSIVVEICEISFRAYVNAAAVEYEADVRLRGENCRLGGNESSQEEVCQAIRLP